MVNQTKITDHEKSIALLITILAVVIGAGLLLYQVLWSDFPLNDGGMFYEMVKELIANGYRLPRITNYNFNQIPYVYPPLQFYIAAVLNNIFGFSLFELERWLPFIYCLLSIPAIGLLSRSIVKSDLQAAIATLAFAISPTTFNRLIMGGGLTRAPGLLFALLALYSIHQVLAYKKRRYLLPAILFSLFVVLSHAVYAYFVVYSALAIFVFSKPKLVDVKNAALIAFFTLLFASVWMVTILQYHGLQPLAAAFSSRSTFPFVVRIGQLLVFNFTGERFLTILGVLTLMGLVKTLMERNFFFITWIVMILMMENTTPTSLLVIPMSMLIGISVAALLFRNTLLPTADLKHASDQRAYQKWVVLIVFTYFVYYSALATFSQLSPRSLSVGERQAMEWIDRNISLNSKFIVITPYSWWEDPYTEWFPALARRKSLNTVQGFEWTTKEEFTKQSNKFDSLNECRLSSEIQCLLEWQSFADEPFTHIFIPKRPAYTHPSVSTSEMPLLDGLLLSEQATVLYDDADVLILGWKP